MCHSCVSSSPGFFAPAPLFFHTPVSFLRKQESRISASPLVGEAGQPTAWPGEGELDSRFRGNDIQGDKWSARGT